MNGRIPRQAFFWLITGLLILVIVMASLYYHYKIREIDRRMREKGVSSLRHHTKTNTRL